ncbi:MAG: GIY-YIG nuclease family protein [Bacteroidia bacterium]|nr:GIY-YIG nuclease family protein [Bacteroidia bacterium]
MSKFFVYVLKSEKDGRLYKGFTNNIDRRIDEHNKGQNKSTKGFRPWKLVHIEKFATLTEARNREKFLKTGQGRDYLKKILVT